MTARSGRNDVEIVTNQGGSALGQQAPPTRLHVVGLRDTVHRELWNRPALWRVAAAAGHPSHRGERLAAVGRALRYQVMTESLGRRITLPIGERSKIYAYPGERQPVFALVRNPPNWPDMLVWRRYLRPGDLFIDVGANIGAYTIYALDCGAEVIAVEPNPRSAARVAEHLDLNGYRAEVVQKALTDRPGTVRMTDGLDVLNHLVDASAEGIDVEATTLDEVLGDRTAFVKIDVEGAEELVLAGASHALAERRIPVLQLEWIVAPQFQIEDRTGTLALLAEAGYELCECDRYGALHPLGERTPSTMNVFARPRQET